MLLSKSNWHGEALIRTGSSRPRVGTARSVSPLERVYFLAVGVLALWVGFWGYFVPGQVTKAIPFLVPPLHARFIGAIYLSGLVFMIAGIVLRRWGDIRFIPLATAIWTGGLLVVSLLHLEQFDFTKPQSQVWFGAYIVYPAIALLLTWRHGLLRIAYGSGPRRRGWGERYLLVQGVIMALLGTALFLVPGALMGVWPWPITPLLAQIYSAPFIAYAVNSLLLARGTATGIHVIVSALGFLVFSVGVLLASVIHRDLFSARELSDILWFCLFSLGSLLLALLAGRSLAESLRSSNRAARG
jgi:hypothetical protein